MFEISTLLPWCYTSMSCDQHVLSLRFCNVCFLFYLLACETSATTSSSRGMGVTRGGHRTWTKGMDAKETNFVHAAENAQSFPPVESARNKYQSSQVSWARVGKGTL